LVDKNDKSQLDERALAKLLEAAYVVQEDNRKKRRAPPRAEYEAPVARAKPASSTVEGTTDGMDAAQPARSEVAPAAPAPWLVPPDHSAALAKIVETQRELQMRRADLAEPITLIAQRVLEIVRAGGSAVGIVEGDSLVYRAKAGRMTPSAAQLPQEKALSTACLRTGHAVRCDDVDTEFLVDAEECRERGIQSMIAVPVFRDGAVAGVLEIYYASKRGFTEQDVHSAQLMAGLVGEALAREEEKTWKKSLASERAVMLEALEKLKPNLAALVDVSPGKNGAPAASREPSQASSACRKCGHELPQEEQFCGKCGTPRSGVYEAPNMQSKVASLWQMQEAAQKSSPAENTPEPRPDATRGLDDAQFEKLLVDSLEKEMPSLFHALDPHAEDPSCEAAEASAAHPVETSELEKEFAGGEAGDEKADESEDAASEEEASATTALVKAERTPDWSSAENARDFLEQLAGERSGGFAGFWRARRGDFYLALAVILVACVIRWGIWSNRPVSATGTATPAAGSAQQRRKPADADLSLFDRLLINLGVAEAPEPTENKGNPRTEVWVDLHTALYYCPGSDLYGKTPKGKYTTQRDAQLDQFEPAYRKACD
jgi:putative methionine-R-sulfoxide reductase with GAF domain/ribosomal protein L37E